ncbi:hypothetical protein N7492_009003 [Penicillium capsulatum]|uniref:Non-homologous end-joining factor 1 n=1 Tax=Penicillium capsulatum TaxID=69766 RepID=A0A9W9HTU0_9EURO|nr:hypothetical protein N7492_009003 [Penicillium capsulatum]KAJ6106403.1 hypothetical protein N7512_009920 [Penicillium capsulatum]
MLSKWYRLNLPREDLPPLLFQYSANRQGYELFVTDLTSIWSERLSHGEILSRADKTAATIDPSEDPKQLDVLLAKIGEALHSDGGSAALHSGSDVDSLGLITNTKLPAPLKPLQWPFELAKAAQYSLTDKILFPLLREEAGWEPRQRSLLDQLKQKDWVLEKLLDKVEALGVDLGTVFPGAAGLRSARKGSTRSEAAKLIKGIARFDESAWLAESAAGPGGLGLAADLAREISGSADGPQLEKFHHAQDRWWRVLQPAKTSTLERKETSSEVESQISRTPPNPPKKTVSPNEGAATESEDEFQTLKGSPPLQAPVPETDEATASESEAEVETASPPRLITSPFPPRPKTISPVPKEAPKKARAGLGVIGGKKKPEKTPRQAWPEVEPSTKDHQERAETRGQVVSPSKPKRTAKLGMIGGKAKAEAKATGNEPTPPRTEDTGPSDMRPARPPETDRPVLDSTGTEKSPEVKSKIPENIEPVSAAPETEEERANRKREELKRQLQVQSKAPAKKKRRF